MSNHADLIEFTAARHTASLRYGLVVLVPVLPTSCYHDAVPVRYLTAFTAWKRTLTAPFSRLPRRTSRRRETALTRPLPLIPSANAIQRGLHVRGYFSAP